MSSDIVIRAENLGKRYRLFSKEEYVPGLRKALGRVARSPIDLYRQIRSLTHFEGQEEKGVFWALRDVGFEVRRGEVVGIIGNNGAGKSTLLKILSRITAPTTGRAEIFGRVSSLLEVGTGFHPDLTGRENIYMNGTLHGMSKREIDRKLDAIVDFSGVEKFIDMPIKRYSSGMGVRLGFAVAAHLDAEVLIVDEVMAVGDLAFQKKCLQTLSMASETGRTVLLVSHNIRALTGLAKRSILLEGGGLAMDGETPAVVARYLQQDETQLETGTIDVRGATRRKSFRRSIEFLEIRLADDANKPTHDVYEGEPFRVTLTFEVKKAASIFEIVLYVENFGSHLFAVSTGLRSGNLEPGLYQASVRIAPNYLNPGSYAFSCMARTARTEDALYDVFPFEVVSNPAKEASNRAIGEDYGLLTFPHAWEGDFLQHLPD